MFTKNNKKKWREQGQIFQKLLISETVYKPSEIGEMLKASCADADFQIKRKKDKTQVAYANVPAAFDIETTSFVDNGKECGTMYAWGFGLNGAVMVGRTWHEFLDTVKAVKDFFSLRNSKRLILYVHNLSFDFAFFRKWFDFSEVFAVKPLTPIYAVTDMGIEFRDSYILSALSLEKTGKNLLKYKIEKAVGDLDYRLKRHTATPLQARDVGYIARDVKVVMAYIQECIEEEGDITKIPYTNTGRVRRYTRSLCFSGGKYARYDYMRLMQNLTLTADELLQWKRAFQGGFTHGNPYEIAKTHENVASYDLTSAYPAVMLSEMYPMSKGEFLGYVDLNTFKESLKYYCCIFDACFGNLRPKIFTENYISESKCRNVRNVVTTNGRVVTADYIETTITETDFAIIQQFYTWDKGSFKVANFRRYKKGYLPKPIFKAVLDLYKAKTELKNVDGMESEYLKSKGMLNSLFGMCCTSVLRDTIGYSGKSWTIEHPNVDEVVEKYNSDVNRFLFYPWGVKITSFNRYVLATAIRACGTDYIYSDTDSVKIKNREKHKKYFDAYNDWVFSRLKTALNYYGFDESLICPKTKEGKIKTLGVWDYEGTYSRFKTLGAKRYMTEKDGKISITVSGLNKSVAVPYILDESEKLKISPFDFFDDGMYIPAGYTGKNIHKYFDDEMTGEITDYLGNKNCYHELSCVYLTESDYHLSMSENMAENFTNYITNLLQNRWEWRE